LTAPPLPAGFRLAIDPDVRRPHRGVVIGGTPVRVLRLRDEAVRLFDLWEAGGEVGTSPAAGRFARRLVDAGIAHPRPPGSPKTDVCVVIPVRDRQDGLQSTLHALAHTRSKARVIVVDDGSMQPVKLEDDFAGRCSVVRLCESRGPARARNEGWRLARGDVVVFLDADCVPSAGWLENLLGHFSDPAVAAVAPRVISPADTRTALARYEMVRSSLDLGAREAPVRPRSRVPYVPTACLAVRREALLQAGGFNENLRFGEDVDLVWRLHDLGWAVRYEPAVSVVHPARPSMRGWVVQRFGYGMSAASLAELHGPAVAPLDVSPWSAAVWALVAAGQPVAAGLLAAGTGAVLARRAGRDLRTATQLGRLAVRGNIAAGARMAEAVRRAWLPPLLAVALFGPSKWRRRSAALLIAAFAVPGAEWFSKRPPLGPGQWVALRGLDDLAYQCGVWSGAAKARSAKALLPRF
jgi:mycofactocin system glycosyltransferase